MPKFITFFSYTAESAKAMIERPSDRSAATNTLIEAVGGTQEGFYWMHGKHDGFVISNLPDGITAAAVSAAVGATGAVARLETHQIFDQDEQAAILKARTLLARPISRRPRDLRCVDNATSRRGLFLASNYFVAFPSPISRRQRPISRTDSSSV